MQIRNRENQSNLNNIIEMLSAGAKNTEEISYFVGKLKDIYSEGFRHSYSSITGILLQLNKQDKSLETILENLSMIKEMVGYDEIRPQLDKLYDHISLETIRIEQLYNSYSENLNNAKETVLNAQDTINKLQKHANKLEDEAARLKTDVITILSIFAAIIITFTGGISFTSGVFDGISEASIYRLVGVMTLCGFIIFNTISALLYIVAKIIGKTIALRCDTEDCTCEKKCNNISILRKRYPLIFWINVIMILFMVSDILIWWIRL